MTVAFIGNRELNITPKLKSELTKLIKELIVNNHAEIFLFGSFGEFNKLCYQIVTELKNQFPHISRVYVRAEYEHVSQSYIDYLLTEYEDTFFPKSVHGAGAKSYIKRNMVMIDMCNILIYYSNPNFVPHNSFRQTKSGTKLAIEYATQKDKNAINLFSLVDE